MDDRDTSTSKDSTSSWSAWLFGVLAAGGVITAAVQFVLPKLWPENKPPISTIETAGVSENKALVGAEVVFIGTKSSDPDGGLLNYQWEIDDLVPDAPANGSTFRWSFTQPGIYVVKLIVKDPKGLTAQDSFTVSVQSVRQMPEPEPEPEPEQKPEPRETARQDIGSACEAYAELAINQHKVNLDKNCGFGGPQWSVDFDGHYQWCLVQTESTRASEVDQRELRLRECDQRPQKYFNNVNLLWGDIGPALGFSPADCEKACADSTECQAWTWVKQGGLPLIERPGEIPFCALKDSQSLQKIDDPCCVSGFK